MKSLNAGTGKRAEPVRMSANVRPYAAFLVIALAVAFVATASRSFAYEEAKAEIEWGTLKFFIEFNDTDQDVGVQALIDGEPWKRLQGFDPNGKKMMNIQAKRSIKKQGFSELFFESAEPSLDEVSLATFLNRFPEGEYDFEGDTIEGDTLVGSATFTHTIPAGPLVLSPLLDGEEPAEVPVDEVLIEWDPVTETIDGAKGLEITGYQVIVEQEDPLRVLIMDLPATVTSVLIPEEFFEQLDEEHAFEILAQEVSGNQTITSSAFIPVEP